MGHKVSLFLGLFFFFLIEITKLSGGPEKSIPLLLLWPVRVGFDSLCFLSGSALAEFEQVPVHLTDDLHLFSLEDLVKVKKGLLVPSLKDILKVSLEHVAGCEVRFDRPRRARPKLSLLQRGPGWVLCTLSHLTPTHSAESSGTTIHRGEK